MNTQNDCILVSKVCHDLANSLAYVVFLREDIQEGTVDPKEGIEELCKKIEPLALKIKFFQNITIQKEHIENLYQILQQLCELHNIELNIQNKISAPTQHPFYEENVVCGVLYILVDYAIKRKLYSEISVTFTDDDKITIFIPNIKAEDLPNDLNDLTNTSEITPNVQNAFAYYIRTIMIEHHYVAYSSDVRSQETGLNIVICRL